MEVASPPPPPPSPHPPHHFYAPSPPPVALSTIASSGGGGGCSLHGATFLVAGRQVGQAEFEQAHLEAPLHCAPLCGEHEGMAFGARHFFLQLHLRKWDEDVIIRLTLHGAALRLASIVGGT